MTKLVHNIYISTMVLIVIGVSFYLAKTGYDYYSLPLEERFYHSGYEWLKPSGIFGQGLGVIGTLMIAFGVTIYILRKRYGFMERWIRLKYLLEFHIFLCTLGPILIVFHTTFKFGGIVSIAFWSMVAVVLSGVIGRFIYIQIPRSIEGRELSIQEIHQQRKNLLESIRELSKMDNNVIDDLFQNDVDTTWSIRTVFNNKRKLKVLKKKLRDQSISGQTRKEILNFAKKEMDLTSRIGRLQQMQMLFHYWHVIHMPFALIMLIIVVIHVIVTVSLGYTWIF